MQDAIFLHSYILYNLWRKNYYCFHFIDGKTKAQKKMKHLVPIHTVGSRARVNTHVSQGRSTSPESESGVALKWCGHFTDLAVVTLGVGRTGRFCCSCLTNEATEPLGKGAHWWKNTRNTKDYREWIQKGKLRPREGKDPAQVIYSDFSWDLLRSAHKEAVFALLLL